MRGKVGGRFERGNSIPRHDAGGRAEDRAGLVEAAKNEPCQARLTAFEGVWVSAFPVGETSPVLARLTQSVCRSQSRFVQKRDLEERILLTGEHCPAGGDGISSRRRKDLLKKKFSSRDVGIRDRGIAGWMSNCVRYAFFLLKLRGGALSPKPP